MKKLGVIVEHLDVFQESLCIIYNLNQLHDVDVCLFCSDRQRTAQQPIFPVMNTREALYFDGVLIANDFQTLNLLNQCYTKDKYLYIWNMDWIYQPHKFDDRMPNLTGVKLIARSPTHYPAISNTLKAPKEIIPDFNHRVLRELCRI